MNFKINVKGLLEGIQPAVTISTVSTVKDYPTADHIALEATPDCLFAIANGGRASIKTPIHFMGAYCTDYAFISGGTISVKTSDLLAVLNSFSSDEVLTVDAIQGETGNELSLRPISDPEQVQTIPFLSKKIEIAKEMTKVSKQVKTSRDLFCKSLSRILFAGGFEEKRARYMFWVLRADTGMIRFAAGNGSRFAILSKHGQFVSDAKSPLDLLVPVDPSHAILKVMSNAKGDDLIIRQSDESDKQYTFECGDLKIAISGMYPPVKWIDENSILTRTNNYRITIGLKDYEMVIRGITATNNDETKEQLKKAQQVHATLVAINSEKNILQLNSTGAMKALRKIKASDIRIKDGLEPSVALRCVTVYLSEVVKYASGSEYIQIDMIDSQSPMVVRFNANSKVTDGSLTKVDTVTGEEEEFVMVIAKFNDTKS